MAGSSGLAQRKTVGLSPGEGFTDTTTMQTPNNPATMPRGPSELSTRNKNIRAALMIIQRCGGLQPNSAILANFTSNNSV